MPYRSFEELDARLADAADLLITLAITAFLDWVHYRTNTAVQLLVAIPAGIVGAAFWAFAVGPALLGA